MAPRESPLSQFIKDALKYKKYPNLFWTNRDERIFCLSCIIKSKRGWNPMYSKIYDDYHRLKPRKSNDKRQRFLVAMKACPFIKSLEDTSSREEKYYKLLGHGTLSVDATDEITVLTSNEDVDIQSVQFAYTGESGPDTGAGSVEIEENDLGDYSSPMLVDNNSLEAPFAFNPDEGIQTEIDELLSSLGASGMNISEANFSTPMLAESCNSLPGSLDVFGKSEEISWMDEQIEDSRMDMVVPNVGAKGPETPDIGASTSFFNGSVNLITSSVCCNQAPDILDPSCLEEETSYSFKEIGYYPPNYDPDKDFIKSFEVPKPADKEAVYYSASPQAGPDQLENVQMMPSMFGESSKCEVAGVFRLNDNHSIVKRLQQNSTSVGDSGEKHYFMMVLKRDQI